MPKEYIKAIQAAATAREDKFILNATMAHAEIGIRALFEHAANGAIVKVIAGDFMTTFWSKLKESIANFISKQDGKLEVIVTKDQSVFLGELLEEFPGKVEAYTLLPEVKDEAAQKIPHIVAVTSGGFRFEESDDQRDDEIVKGVLNYGNVDKTLALIKVFDSLKAVSRQIGR
jgi:hypothetical protein